MVPPTPEVQDWINTSIDTFLRLHSPDGINGDESMGEIILFLCMWTRTRIPDILQEFFWISARKLRKPEFIALVKTLKSDVPYSETTEWKRFSEGDMSNTEIQRIVIENVYAVTTNALDRRIKRYVENLCDQINKRYNEHNPKISGIHYFFPMNKENIKPLLSSYLLSKQLENTILIMKTAYENRKNKEKVSQNIQNNN